MELFTGAGGLALGVSASGFRHAAVIERDPYACDSIRENKRAGTLYIREWPLVASDVRYVEYSDYGGNVDLVAGGPPCQPFSLGGKHRAQADSRDMFPEAVRSVRELRPRAFMFENVKGLTRRAFATYFQYIQLQLCYPEVVRAGQEEWLDHLARLEKHHTSGTVRGLRYKVVVRLLNSANYGVPQKRERVFIVGFRSDIAREWSFPRTTHSEDALLFDQWVSGEYWERHRVAKCNRPTLPSRWVNKVARLRADGRPSLTAWPTVRDAIGDLPSPTTGASPRIPNHTLIQGARSYPGHTGSPLDWPSKTLKAGVHGVPGGENMVDFGDGGVRYFSVREAARIQTFPDNYIFHGSWTETMRQLGNAVPVTLATSVASAVARCLKETVT